MGASAFFDVINALYAQTPAAVGSSVLVTDGYPDIESAPDKLLCIGVPNPSDESAATSATARQDWAHANFTARDEEGDVYCVASVVNGAGDQAQARTDVKAILTAVEDMLRATPNLGVSTLLWTSFGADVSYLQNQDSDGALAEVSFSIHYRARI